MRLARLRVARAWTQRCRLSLTPASSSTLQSSGSRQKTDWNPAGLPVAELQQMSRLVAALREIPKKVAELEVKANEEEGIYREDATIAASSRSGLFYRQLKIEEEALDEAAHNYMSQLKNIMELGRGTGMKHVQKRVLKWYEPLHSAIEREKQCVLNSVAAKDRQQYGPILLLLSTEKLAVIALNTTLNQILRTGNVGVPLVTVARSIGELVEAEVNITKLQVGSTHMPVWQQNIIKESYDDGSKYRRSISKRVRMLLNDDAWSPQIKIKLGAALIKLLVESSKNEDGEEIFLHTAYFYASIQKRLGLLRLDGAVFKSIAEKGTEHVLPRYLPMLVPPKAWNNKFRSGCYFRLRTPLMRTFSPSHLDSLKRADMGPILEGLNYLGQVPWRINTQMLKIIREAIEKGISIGEIPPNINVPLPLESDCFRVPSKLTLQRFTKMKAAAVAKASKRKGGAGSKSATETEGGLPLASVSSDPPPTSSIDGGVMMTPPTANDPDQPVFDEKLYKELCRRVKMKNAELHSLRCDLQLKIWVAENFVDDRIYYPYNLDFRGRAYPVPQNLSHLGSDLCRGLLTFEEAKPLGSVGFDWLKVQLANLFGNNKQSLRDRVDWVDKHLDEIFDSVKHPLDGKRWWATAEEPFQALATCIEIVAALESGDPISYMCSMPIHQDGSCNGLQHYAALGRDEPGAIAVNLMPSAVPQDVYSTVLEIVMAKIANDVKIPEDLTDTREREKGKWARLVQDVVNRKVIKQTVMTSVYGVTRIGARAQIQARLEERLMNDPSTVKSPEVDRDVFEASRYVADLTLSSLQEMFSVAKEIMDWLGACAMLVAEAGHVMSWVSPLGLPVMQPYRKTANQLVKTTMQTITLVIEDEALPVSGQRQQSAFPPNFVHSLDATHMLMTSLKMKNMGLAFASVHDSFWTHACDVPYMSVALRETFVELYEQPVLEGLRDSLVRRYPEITFPPVPKGGNLDLEKVKESIYFFH